ncbi:glycine zipper family protein [Malaciobacter pacificus]|uniref:Putative membrane protein n=2 Tax=Malaciobacter pacificus TaxID=1080223 RepID=A0A5C2H7V4_9BACT|nr:interferon alpha-inducible IFI6/IFI27 family protein [Malaciobacter pacificus]QEP35050.1 putative membrane protein [Malaciobacter pacificus]
MNKIFFLLFIIFSINSFAFTEISTSTVQEDYKKGNMDKYKYDNLTPISTSSLVSRGIITNESNLIRNIPEPINKSNIKNHITCSFVGANWTATIYSINAQAGTVTCMVSKKGDLYNPIGTFDTFYPNLKKAFTLDLKTAEQQNQTLINNAETQFQPLKNTINSIYQSTTSQNGNYLTIPELLTAAILTDTDIIDVQSTRATNKLQLKNNFVSSYSTNNQFIDNRDYILTDTETIFDVYSGLSDVSMTYLVLLVAFFGIWGVGSKVLSHFTSKAEDKQNHEKVSPYITGIILGILLFFPTGFKEQITNSSGNVVAEYNLMKTKYQDWEKSGYALFTDWADAAAKVIIDAEVNAIVEKSGVATKDQIIQASAGISQYKNLTDFTNNLWDICRNDIYNYNGLFDSDGKHQYSTDPNQPFPTNEKWAYVNSKIKNNTSTLYYSVQDGEVKGNGSYNPNVIGKVGANNPLDNYYPEYALSACGKNYYEHQSNVTKLKDYDESKKALIGQSTSGANKIPMLQGLIKFQYELYRDWGYLAILGLPVTKLQTEYIGGLYKTKRSEVLDKLNDQVKEDSWGTHMIMSSIPYMFLPGAGTIYKIVEDNSVKIAAAIGTTSGTIAGGGFASWFTGAIGAATGVIAGVAAKSAIALAFAYKAAQTVLEITPIVGIVIIGLLRFVIIMIKIFSFHFASLFMMPIMFARENIQAIARFTMKIFATMLELPIFVLSVWLAITASSLIHTIGDVFGKKIIMGMLENNALQQSNFIYSWIDKMKIYFFDGFIEISVAIFSIIIIYKIIVSLHSTLFEIIEVQGSKELDNAIESMKNESTGWGSRM